jgi:prevent-host-death family protein
MFKSYNWRRRAVHSSDESEGHLMAGRHNVSEARRQFSTVLDRVSKGEWQLIGRRGRRDAVLASASEVAELLAQSFRFSPEVFVEEQGVGVWLPQLEIHGVGPTLEQALDDLAVGMLEYADEWEAGLRHFAEHKARAGYVRRVQLAEDEAGVRALLALDAELAAAANK